MEQLFTLPKSIVTLKQGIPSFSKKNKFIELVIIIERNIITIPGKHLLNCFSRYSHLVTFSLIHLIYSNFLNKASHWSKQVYNKWNRKQKSFSSSTCCASVDDDVDSGELNHFFSKYLYFRSYLPQTEWVLVLLQNSQFTGIKAEWKIYRNNGFKIQQLLDNLWIDITLVRLAKLILSCRIYRAVFNPNKVLVVEFNAGSFLIFIFFAQICISLLLYKNDERDTWQLVQTFSYSWLVSCSINSTLYHGGRSFNQFFQNHQFSWKF